MTAVNYLIKSLDLINWIEDEGQAHEQLKILDQALEIEKEQIIKSFEFGQKDTANGYYIKNGERYYDELYPGCQDEPDDEDIKDRAEAFHDIVVAMGKIKDHQDRLQVYLALQKYIKSA
jgi:hypothetical protein